MHRFLITPESIKNGIAVIEGDDARHLLQVLRHKTGDRLIVFDGTGLQYELQLVSTDRNKAFGRILRKYDPETETKTKVILYQGIPKTDKMDFIIQKSVELGVFQIIPIITEYSVLQLKDRNIENRLERWNRISREACKQSGRVAVPEVLKPIVWKDALNQWIKMQGTAGEGSYLPVLCYENESKKCLKDLFICYNIDHVSKVGIFVGSEGGFSNEELQYAVENGIKPVSLGKRILRAETAAIAVISIIMYEMGEMRI